MRFVWVAGEILRDLGFAKVTWSYAFFGPHQSELIHRCETIDRGATFTALSTLAGQAV